MRIGTRKTSYLRSRRLPIQVIRVESPYLIWVHFQTRESPFWRMNDQFQQYMNTWSSYFVLKPPEAEVGCEVVVAENGTWYRGYICEIQADYVRVALKDWGLAVWRPLWRCYYLPDYFKRVKWMAVPCAIAYVGPSYPGSVWTREVSALTKILAEGKTGWIKIREGIFPEGAYAEMEIPTPTGGIINIGDILILEGHAFRIKELGWDIQPNVTSGPLCHTTPPEDHQI